MQPDILPSPVDCIECSFAPDLRRHHYPPHYRTKTIIINKNRIASNIAKRILRQSARMNPHCLNSRRTLALAKLHAHTLYVQCRAYIRKYRPACSTYRTYTSIECICYKDVLARHTYTHTHDCRLDTTKETISSATERKHTQKKQHSRDQHWRLSRRRGDTFDACITFCARATPLDWSRATRIGWTRELPFMQGHIYIYNNNVIVTPLFCKSKKVIYASVSRP